MSSKMFHSSRRDSGSKPDEGSSNIAILHKNIKKYIKNRFFAKNYIRFMYFVFPINAIPRQSRRFMPPDKLCPYSFAFAVKFNFFSKWLVSY